VVLDAIADMETDASYEREPARRPERWIASTRRSATLRLATGAMSGRGASRALLAGVTVSTTVVPAADHRFVAVGHGTG
jgi:hypothetical protein